MLSPVEGKDDEGGCLTSCIFSKGSRDPALSHSCKSRWPSLRISGITVWKSAEIPWFDPGQVTYNTSCVRYIGDSKGSYTFCQSVADVLLSCHRGRGAGAESGSDECRPWRVTWYPHLSKVKPKALLDIQPICSKEIFSPLFPRDDDNFSLCPREVRRRQ